MLISSFNFFCPTPSFRMTPPSDNGTPPPIHAQPNVPTTQRVPKKIQPAKMSKSYQFWKIWPKFALSSSFFNSFWPIFDLFLNVQTQKRHNRLLVPRNQCYSSMEEGVILTQFSGHFGQESLQQAWDMKIACNCVIEIVSPACSQIARRQGKARIFPDEMCE